MTTSCRALSPSSLSLSSLFLVLLLLFCGLPFHLQALQVGRGPWQQRTRTVDIHDVGGSRTPVDFYDVGGSTKSSRTAGVGVGVEGATRNGESSPHFHHQHHYQQQQQQHDVHAHAAPHAQQPQSNGKKSTIQQVLRDYRDTIQQIMRFSNEQRRQYHLPELKYNAELSKTAQFHAEDMAENDYMSHTNQNGDDLAERVLANSDYRYQKVGENLYCRWPFNEPNQAVEGWMKSTEHRENLLNREFQELGIGYAQGNGDKHYYVQVFGTPAPGCLVDGEEATRKVLHKLTNQARLQFTNLAPLTNCDKLNRAAQRHAEDMARSGRLSGDGDNHGSVLESDLVQAGYSWKTFAANFAFRAPFNDPHSIFQDWLDGQNTSPCYMLDETFSDIGYGYAQIATSDGQKQHYYVQLLGAPAKEPNGANGNVDQQPMSTRYVLHQLTEQAREVAQLRPLHNCEELNEAAQLHAEELARRGRLSGTGLEERIQFTGYPGEAYAANVNHSGPVNDPLDIFQEWLTDREHRYVLDDAFSDVGYGYATAMNDDGAVEHYYVQVLGARLQQLGQQSSFNVFSTSEMPSASTNGHANGHRNGQRVRNAKANGWTPQVFRTE